MAIPSKNRRVLRAVDNRQLGTMIIPSVVPQFIYLFIFILYFVKYPTKAQLQLIYKLARSYMFRHYRVIFRELVFITSPSYISISIADVGNTIIIIIIQYSV